MSENKSGVQLLAETRCFKQASHPNTLRKAFSSPNHMTPGVPSKTDLINIGFWALRTEHKRVHDYLLPRRQ